VLRDRYEQELFRRPVVKTQTQPTTTLAVNSTQPVDPQLQQAVTTMIGLVVLQGEKGIGGPIRWEKPVTRTAVTTPVTLPSETPATAPSSKKKKPASQPKEVPEPASQP
jgi:hypothetical protein